MNVSQYLIPGAAVQKDRVQEGETGRKLVIHVVAQGYWLSDSGLGPGCCLPQLRAVAGGGVAAGSRSEQARGRRTSIEPKELF